MKVKLVLLILIGVYILGVMPVITEAADRYCFAVLNSQTKKRNVACFDTLEGCNAEQAVEQQASGTGNISSCVLEKDIGTVTIPNDSTPTKPTVPFASRIIPCTGVVSKQTQDSIDANLKGGKTNVDEVEKAVASDTGEKVCRFGDFIQLIKNLINFAFIVTVPISMIAFTWVGILLVTAQGNAGKVEQAKGIASKVGIGFLFIVGAWIIVNSVISVLLKPEFNPFLK